MPTGSTTLHEAEERLTSATRDMHRAIVSLMEELEAVDWYQQRMEATDDAELRDILRHNRDEEKEHAAMVLEWIRRHDPAFDAKLREYLFREGSIVVREREVEAGAVGAAGTPNGSAAPGTTIGSLRGGR
jgi:ferritin-like protein